MTASYGTEGFTTDHLDALRTQRTARVLIAYDRDPAGDKAAEALAERLMAEGIECFRIVLPRGVDANAHACGAASATEALGRVIRAAQWMGAANKTRLHRADPVSPPVQPPASGGATKEQIEVAVEPEPDPSFVAGPLAASPAPAPPPGPEPELVGDELRLILGERR